tara:strand:- start:255 stop:491 length:237 start_codon:yes stop_codon:yes gene_type:complete
MTEDSTAAPSEQEISAALDQYHAWLADHYEQAGELDEAITLATEKALTLHPHSTGKVFFWLTQNDPALIYDVDDSFKH